MVDPPGEPPVSLLLYTVPVTDFSITQGSHHEHRGPEGQRHHGSPAEAPLLQQAKENDVMLPSPLCQMVLPSWRPAVLRATLHSGIWSAVSW